jgi:hypothetical protein
MKNVVKTFSNQPLFIKELQFSVRNLG